MVDFVELSVAILPFIFGLIAIALIPSKVKIVERKVRSFAVEAHIVVYLIALIIGMMGLYYFMPLFVETTEGQLLNIINGLFLGAIALGITGLNYRNYSIFLKTDKETDISIDERIPSPVTDDYTEVAPVEPKPEARVQPKKSSVGVKPQLLQCPQCKNTIKITVTKRPLKISCPHCGVEGIIQ